MPRFYDKECKISKKQVNFALRQAIKFNFAELARADNVASRNSHSRLVRNKKNELERITVNKFNNARDFKSFYQVVRPFRRKTIRSVSEPTPAEWERFHADIYSSLLPSPDFPIISRDPLWTHQLLLLKYVCVLNEQKVISLLV